MKIVGIICEYNPFHLGHEKQFRQIRSHFGEDCAIVCLMSGNFVQRGHPALLDKALRARCALECGADLVLEMPVVYALSSAEGFAVGGVRILGQFCDFLCFGAESATEESLMQTAKMLLTSEFSEHLRGALELGLSFPAARQNALEALGADSSLLQAPNDILAVEYCKAILSQNSSMRPFVIRREGCYHDILPDPANPSATSLRALALSGQAWHSYVPEKVSKILKSGDLHALSFGERAVLARLRTMSEAEFSALPYGSEGLWRKLMHAAKGCAGLEEILTAVKSKRYTRTRLDRMVLCAFLSLSAWDLAQIPPYVRVLGFRETGRAVLKKARQSGQFPHIGEKTGHPYEMLETRCDDLYALFREDSPGPAGETSKRRVCII